MSHLQRSHGEKVVATGEQPCFGCDLSSRVCVERLQANPQQAIASLSFDSFVGVRLRRKRFTQKVEKKLKPVTIEFAELRQARGLAAGETCASLLDFTIFFGQLRLEPFSLRLTVLHAR